MREEVEVVVGTAKRVGDGRKEMARAAEMVAMAELALSSGERRGELAPPQSKAQSQSSLESLSTLDCFVGLKYW